MPRGAGVDGRTSAADVLRDVRRHVERAHVGDERRRVITLVGRKCQAPHPGRMAHDHRFGCRALGAPGRLGQRRRDDEPAAVFHQHVAHHGTHIMELSWDPYHGTIMGPISWNYHGTHTMELSWDPYHGTQIYFLMGPKSIFRLGSTSLMGTHPNFSDKPIACS